MADNQGASNPGGGGGKETQKKTLDQGVQLLPLLIKYFKSVGFLLGVWVLGYFRFSSTWVMVGLLAYMLNEEYRKIKDSKRKFAAEAVKNEKAAILARCEELPSWVSKPAVYFFSLHSGAEVPGQRYFAAISQFSTISLQCK